MTDHGNTEPSRYSYKQQQFLQFSLRGTILLNLSVNIMRMFVN